MDFNTLRAILREEGGKVFIVGGEGDPPLVVLQLDEYQELRRARGGAGRQEIREEPFEGLRMEDLPV